MSYVFITFNHAQENWKVEKIQQRIFTKIWPDAKNDAQPLQYNIFSFIWVLL